MRILPLLLALCLGSAPCHAMFAPPRLAPVDRLVQSAEADVKTRPTAADARYTLARVHYLAFSSKRDQVVVQYYKEGERAQLLSPAMTKMIGRYTPPNAPKPNEIDATKLVEHAAAAKMSFEEALRLEPRNAAYHLGYASLLEEVRAWLAASKPPAVPPELAAVKTGDLRKAYAEALATGLPKDSTLKQQPLQGLEEITSFEAAKALIRLAEAEPASLTAEEKKSVDQAREAMARFNKLPMGPITPIVLSMQPARHLEEMLAPEVTVDFDLRGYGAAERWSWVKPALGFLVWDPLATGQIESARDLFGSFSFQIMRKTGYDALAALDDNRDGQLAGAELSGIRVWFDDNSDGVSTVAEVKSLDVLGITAIAVRETARDGRYPMNPTGLTLRDGRTLPTWDWIAEPRAAGE